jgi:hypothetical protein
MTWSSLALFYDLRQLTLNLGKTKVMIFKGLKKTSDLHFFFRGEEIEITNTYTYLGVQFSGPRFSLLTDPPTSDQQGLRILIPSRETMLRHHFQDISSKMSLMDSLIRPIVLYGSEIWGPSLLEFDWASTERVQTLLLRRIIR